MILAWNAAHKEMHVVGWHPAYGAIEEDHWNDVGNRNAAPALYFNANYFQLWRPLPEAPGPVIAFDNVDSLLEYLNKDKTRAVRPQVSE